MRIIWRIRIGKFARHPIFLKTANINVVEFECPIIKPEGQAHLFKNKLYNIDLALKKLNGITLQMTIQTTLDI